MSSALKTVLVVIVLVAIAGGAYYWYDHKQAPVAEVAQEEGGTPAANEAALPSGSNTADSALEADLSAVDSQISAFGTDNTAVSSSMNDQAVGQASL